ncbi:unnamed protein product, partial [marine sediment metagenome]
MPYTEIADWSGNTSEGVQTLFAYVADVVPLFIPFLLISLFMIILLGSFFSQRRLSGRAHFAGSFAVAGYVTFIAAISLTLMENVI